MKMVTNKHIGIFVLLLIGITAITFGDDNFSLMIQVSPVNGGMISPAISSSGVFSAARGEAVTVTATANPGYRFVYWLGDVANATANSTSVVADSPKILVAVFQRESLEDNQIRAAGITSSSGGAGSGGSRGRAPSVTVSGPSTSGTGGSPGGFTFPNFPNFTGTPGTPGDQGDPGDNGDNSTDNDPIPVPEDGTEVVPEPTSIALLGLGGLFLRKRRARRK